MLISRIKLLKKLIVSLPIVCVIFFLYFIVGPYIENYGTEEKLKSIIYGINSLTNQEVCRIPNISAYAPEMMKFIENLPPLECGDPEDDWVSCQLNVCTIKESVIARKGKILCDFNEIRRKTEYINKYDYTFKSVDNSYTLKHSDFAKVYCWSTTRESWSGIVYGVRPNVATSMPSPEAPKLFNVVMYGFDSLSRNAVIRKLPITLKYLTEELGGDVLNGYNIVGDGTPQALIPILTGFTELELPETRKRYPFSDFVDVYPMIWKSYKNKGYITAWNEDIPSVGTFTYRLKGFKNQPTDHYLRTYYTEQENYKSDYTKFCISHQAGHNVMLDYTKQILLNQKDVPKFIFSFHGELSHGSINHIGLVDTDLKNWLVDLRNADILNNTVLILMSDHGNRFAEVRNSIQGKLEERLPFFSFIFPKWFKTKYARAYENFRLNLNRLTTPFDIHATLAHLLALQTDEPYPIKSNRAISLLNEVSAKRSCADAFIESHWCSCVSWKEIDQHKATHVAHHLVKFLNNITESNRELCAKLELHDINWAGILRPQENLIKFKSSKDQDGFLPDLTSDTTTSIEMYQIKITVVPGNSIFEASVAHDLRDRTYIVKQSDISRINKYGNQARCIYEYNPELRKYCYCKD